MGIMQSVAARELGIGERTLARWADQGKVKATRTPGNWRVYDPADLARLKRELERRREGGAR